MNLYSVPSFDPHQFAGLKRLPFKDIGLDFRDFNLGTDRWRHGGGMHVERHAPHALRQETPRWAMNDAELREVLLKYGERRVYLRTKGNMGTPSTLSDEERFARIRKEELEVVLKRLEVKLRDLIVREKTKPELAEQVQNFDTSILIARRGCVSVANAVVILYYRLGWNSVEVAQELKITSPHVRQFLARLKEAANGTTYTSPKGKRLRAVRAEIRRITELFSRAKTIIDATNRKRTQKEIDELLAKVSRPKAIRKPTRWDYDKLMFIYFLRLQGKSWEHIAPKLGMKRADSVQNGFRYWMRNLDHLPDFRRG